MSKSKRKLLISMLVAMFVLLSAVAIVAIAFALTQQTITTTLNIGYTVTDLDGSVYATYKVGGTETFLQPKATGGSVSEDGHSLVFNAEDTTAAGKLDFPNDIALTSTNDNVIIKYTYANTGDKHYIASMSFASNIVTDNMTVEYSKDGENYSTDRYAVVVPSGATEKSYWIKISITNKAKSASFSGDFQWVLTGYDEEVVGTDLYKSMPALSFEAAGSTGAYKVSVANLNQNDYIGEITFPSSVNGDPVTTVVQNSSLSTSQKDSVINVVIPDSVTAIDDSAFKDYTNLKSVTFKQDVTSSSVKLQSSTGLASIGNYAFENCTKLMDFDMPTTVISIGASAFKNCTSITEIITQYNGTDLSLGSYAFYGCTSLKKVSITDTWCIYDHTFYGCTSLTTLGFEYFDRLEIISEYAFGGCTGVTNINLSGRVTVDSHAFDNCLGLNSITIPDGITINYSAFSNCLNLTSVTVLGQLNGGGAFIGCTGLTNVTLPSGLKSIPDNMFEGCINLASVNIPTSVTSIGSKAFYGCSSLISITIPSSVASFGSNVFGCTGLTNVTLPSGLKSIPDNMFEGCINLASINIPTSVTSIGSKAFYGCGSLTSITIPSGVTNIDKTAFRGCLGLESILVESGNSTYHSAGNCLIETSTNALMLGCNNSVIPTDGSVTEIGEYAFYGCSGLTSITIPNSVTKIGEYAFYGCTGLTSLKIPSSVTEMNLENSFSESTNFIFEIAKIYSEEDDNNLMVLSMALEFSMEYPTMGIVFEGGDCLISCTVSSSSGAEELNFNLEMKNDNPTGNVTKLNSFYNEFEKIGESGLYDNIQVEITYYNN